MINQIFNGLGVVCRGRVFPEIQLTQERKAQEKARRQAFST
ncbi:hypothetical protein [Dolichospermum circinale]|nr:hypothetical protein [Dolichospermum circinale]MDB9454304.1 hypothetical protein [Dolichospermum circinale CS-541/06]MDB9461261.1 hypothetical protein [Dolichospermum circinale CS-541/04]MDB9546226.1 hypothetical protein [Dolichospermum circinale CS-1031]